jgi:hypothetical protein
MREHHHITTSAIVRDFAGIVSGDDEGVLSPLLMGWIKRELGTRFRRDKGMWTTTTMAANYQTMMMMSTLTRRIPKLSLRSVMRVVERGVSKLGDHVSGVSTS